MALPAILRYTGRKRGVSQPSIAQLHVMQAALTLLGIVAIAGAFVIKHQAK